MKTIGHHTCEKKGGHEKVKNAAPFLSEYNEKEDKFPFLGSGYYYWDDNIEMAKKWGKWHYSDDYFVVESVLSLPDGIFLDLVGNRSHIKWFLKLLDELDDNGYTKKEWTLNKYIEYVKELKKETGNEKIFPYIAIRSIDYSATDKFNEDDEKYLISFAKGRKEYTFLNPRLIICLTEKNEQIIESKEIIYVSNPRTY